MKCVDSNNSDMLELFLLAGIKDFSEYRTFDNRTLGHLAASVNNEKAI